jgi:hypothetical protein
LDGTWAAADVKSIRAMQAHAPYRKSAPRTHANKALHDLARDAASIRRQCRLHDTTATIECSSRGYFLRVDVYDAPAELCGLGQVPLWTGSPRTVRVTDLARDAAGWLYHALEREYDWLNSDEQVDETIRANEYTFDEGGHRA